MPTFLLFLLYFAFIHLISVSGQQSSFWLIIRVDDMGFSHSANPAIPKALKEAIRIKNGRNLTRAHAPLSPPSRLG